ncbi:hypothetical protein [Olleya sp. HaHaR_3_96]|uniref:hypothetical protein n=1 Tax=Olleya sp. HaHaR_3_96 TaxID=2745560 RepID=UPI001C500902|nr:hypothetical protein [Olleya sp. HaHaR_3_96]QXP58404.1 hypothetical protein H0I26_10780 [Olleya sp. HaHaR_3_96]
MIVNFKNDELIIEDRHFVDNFDLNIKVLLNKDYPVILHVEGEEVISKKTNNQVGYKKSLLFNANLDDFYFYEYFQDNIVFVSIARKIFIDLIVKQVNDLNRAVIAVAFGPFVLYNLLPIIPNSSSLSSNKYSIQIENAKFTKFVEEQKDIEFTISHEKFNQKELPVLASFFGYKYPSDTISFENDFTKQNREDFIYKGRIKKTVVVSVLLLVFGILLSHFSLESNLRKLSEKQSQYLFSSQKLIELKLLKEELLLKEVIINSNGIFNKNYITKYMVEVGNSVPEDMKLSSINFLPLVKKVRKNEKVNLTENTIIIEGETNNDKVFNNWIMKLQALNWTREIDISYNQISKSTNTFKLTISI